MPCRLIGLSVGHRGIGASIVRQMCVRDVYEGRVGVNKFLFRVGAQCKQESEEALTTGTLFSL